MSDLKDPRVYFAAERTLLAWNRTSLTLMAFGFVIERFGLLLHALLPPQAETLQRGLSFWIGLVFIILGSLCSAAAIAQYRTILRSLNLKEVPEGYLPNIAVLVSLTIALLGVALTAYLMHGSGM